MSMSNAAPEASTELARHQFSFNGSAGEYFKIWIVNLVLSIMTLGVFSAWAKVRSKRYFYGNTTVARHNFEYHGNPIRILIGRVIAALLLLGYSLSGYMSPVTAGLASLVLLIAAPWLIVQSLRFNARNSSYRNVRLHFRGGYWQAAKVMYLWPLLAVVTLYTTAPLAHRAANYFYVNKHTYGGSPLHMNISGGKMYRAYALCLLPALALFAAGIVELLPMFAAVDPEDQAAISAVVTSVLPLLGTGYFALIAGMLALQTLAFNLTINNMKLSERHEFRSTLSPWVMLWIGLSNLVVVLLTLGLAYPWARVRVARYQFSHITLLAASDMSEFAADTAGDVNAVGEEISGFFDLDFGI